MTTQQNDAMAMTDQELEQVHGGFGLGWLLRFILKKDLEHTDEAIEELCTLPDHAADRKKEVR